MIPKRFIRRQVMRLVYIFPVIWIIFFISSLYVDNKLDSDSDVLFHKDKRNVNSKVKGMADGKLKNNPFENDIALNTHTLKNLQNDKKVRNFEIQGNDELGNLQFHKGDDKKDNEMIIQDNDGDAYEETESKDEADRKVLAAPMQIEAHLIDPNAPGEMGKPVVIDKEKLSPEERKVYDKGWKDNAYNQYASDMISLHRTLPDVRDPECKTINYSDNLPETCVIIIFHNEAWSVLLRTVHSVLDRSKPTLLKEIILVDDFSNFEHLKQPLQDYVDELPKVQLVRATERSGLIRARLMGFDKCTAQVAIFLDSHCEATEGWLEPLLSRIGENKTNVLVPVIDAISDETLTLQYQSSKDAAAGGHNWGLIFTWHSVPEYERKRRNYKDYLPFRSPTMAGGLFAISSDFFRYLGTYDSGMDIWGGENLELSFKTWMCGGTLETIPCSHVGHIFRKRSPYKWSAKGDALKRNLVRLAEVWLDDFKTYYYQRISNDLGDYGDISERLELRRKLKCKSFRWYLNEIYPELFVPSEAIASGEIRNAERDICADASSESTTLNQPVVGYTCHNQGGNQYWLLTKEHVIRRDDACWDSPDGLQLKTFACHGDGVHQDFTYREDDTIYNGHFKKCVELSLDGKELFLAECTNRFRQKWKMNRNPPKGPTREEY